MGEDIFVNVTDDQRIAENEFRKYLFHLEAVNPELISYGGMLCLRAWMNGHICISIEELKQDSLVIEMVGGNTDDLHQMLLDSSLIGSPGELTPLIVDEQNLYLHKYWSYEKELADWLSIKAQQTNTLERSVIDHIDELFENDGKINWQRIAVKLALIKDLIIISGGPGTGKTFTVSKILKLLSEASSETLSVALAAPTGKAAQRLNDSLSDQDHEAEIPEATTLHKLLGARGDTGSFRFNSVNKLPHDVVIVDEASMLDITMWINMIRALKDDSKLILLGDKNQLASVEAGSILGDICFNSENSFSDPIKNALNEAVDLSIGVPDINDCIVHLTKSYRFDDNSGIKRLADAINTGDHELVLELLNSEEYPEIRYREGNSEDMKFMIQEFVVNPFQNTGTKADSQTHQILCALRKGPFGVEHINEISERELKRTLRIPSSQTWFPGRPVIITKNNPVLNIRNGETGFASEQEENSYQIRFDNAQTPAISVSRLQDFEPAYAITVHKSQGSEYENVAVLLSNAQNRVLTKELLYTSVTRARQNLLVISSDNIIKSTVQGNIKRNSGLRSKIWYG